MDEDPNSSFERSSVPRVPSAIDPQEVKFVYTNWKGEIAVRRVIPVSIWFGSTEYHKEPQWLLTAIDLDKGARRDFAMVDIQHWTPANNTDKSHGS